MSEMSGELSVRGLAVRLLAIERGDRHRAMGTAHRNAILAGELRPRSVWLAVEAELRRCAVGTTDGH